MMVLTFSASCLCHVTGNRYQYQFYGQTPCQESTVPYAWPADICSLLCALIGFSVTSCNLYAGSVMRLALTTEYCMSLNCLLIVISPSRPQEVAQLLDLLNLEGQRCTMTIYNNAYRCTTFADLEEGLLDLKCPCCL